MLEVKKAIYVGDYNIQLAFNNGREGIADLKATIFNDKRPVFSKLRKESDFKNFKVGHSAIIWADDLDLASEYLFFLAFRDEPGLQEQFKLWGYIE
jgi:hypothetical protein